MPRQRTQQDWPVPDERLQPNVAESETLVGVVGPPAGARRWYDDHLAAGLIALLVLVLLVAGAAYYLHQRHHHHTAAPPRTVVVTTVAKAKTPPPKAMPPLVGLTQQAAVARLQRMHVSATVVQHPSSRPSGTVVSQRPAQASALTATTPVTLVVSTGVTKIAVPNLVGQPVAQARASLTGLGLRTATTSVTMAGKTAGTVVDQAPKPGKKLAKNGLVTLSVVKAPGAGKTATTGTTTAPSSQPQSATVPDVSGQEEPAAVQALAQAGILPSLVFVSSSDPLGTVEAQAKPQGTTVPYHSHLQINVSSGQNPTTEQMPNVVGSTLQQALARINGAHLRMLYVKLSVPRNQAGKIVQQTPLPGSGAPQGAQVLVFLGVYR
jgi:beta-lactam-binding protein with PASTA domain